MTSSTTGKGFPNFLLYIFGFLLLWEWLRPLEQLTATGNIHLFLIFLIVAFGLYIIGAGKVLGAAVKVLYIVYALNYFHLEGSFFSLQWLPSLIADIQSNAVLVLAAEWQQLTDMFRSLLFFVLLWLMAYLIQYWLISRRKIFIFFFMTLIYITVLDTFTPYQADGAIIRTVIGGFTLMGLLTFFRLVETESINKGAFFSKKWIVPLAGMVAFSAIFGYIAPKAEPIWPDPVPFITSYNQESGSGEGGGIRRVGYGTDDSRLGGPFIGSEQLVFRAEIESRHYWKVETKDVYTGKGWVVSEENPAMVPFAENEPVPISAIADGVETDERKGSLFFSQNYSHITYPVGLKEISGDIGYSFEVNPVTEKINTLRSGELAPINQYTVTYEIPEYSVTALRETANANSAGLDAAFIEQYTQVPDGLPDRVRELAENITAGETSWFNKARKIEQYFGRSGFTYDQTDVAIPGPNDDYVDQFLFETKKGYCDNYSTSMAIMLRTLGIPARWVKGFTEGEFIEMSDGNKRIFEIRNNNAHSWVEVFFPNAGWVQFEPTQGFSNSTIFNFDSVTTQQPNTQTATPAQTPRTPQLEKPKEPGSDSKSTFSFKNVWEAVKDFFAEHWDRILLAAAGAGIIAFILYKYRTKWLPYYFIWRFRHRNDNEDFAKAYLVLLKQFDRFGLIRKGDQTLREYANYIDSFFSSQEMSNLTDKYEHFLYRGKLEDGSWAEMKELWQNLIKKTSA
ncbi:transglutaminase [Bacillus sp. V3-13]|nr:transglutaminase [Bacillus sp. V3-13]